MDYHAFDKLSYGLYIVSSEAGGKAAGCIVNTLGQVTVSPVQVAVTINKENQTTRTILESGRPLDEIKKGGDANGDSQKNETKSS